VTDKTCQSPRFLAKLLPAPSQRKNVLAILVDLKFRDGHIRNKKNITEKNVTNEMLQTYFFAKVAVGTLPNEECFEVFDCFEVLRWP